MKEAKLAPPFDTAVLKQELEDTVVFKFQPMLSLEAWLMI